jgi:hypothetical protein
MKRTGCQGPPPYTTITTTFPAWTGEAPPFRYGAKPVVGDQGVACVAEVAFLRRLQREGFEFAAWVSAYGGLRSA